MSAAWYMLASSPGSMGDTRMTSSAKRIGELRIRAARSDMPPEAVGGGRLSLRTKDEQRRKLSGRGHGRHFCCCSNFFCRKEGINSGSKLGCNLHQSRFIRNDTTVSAKPHGRYPTQVHKGVARALGERHRHFLYGATLPALSLGCNGAAQRRLNIILTRRLVLT